jgi:hypothetical protein
MPEDPDCQCACIWDGNRNGVGCECGCCSCIERRARRSKRHTRLACKRHPRAAPIAKNPGSFRLSFAQMAHAAIWPVAPSHATRPPLFPLHVALNPDPTIPANAEAHPPFCLCDPACMCVQFHQDGTVDAAPICECAAVCVCIVRAELAAGR